MPESRPPLSLADARERTVQALSTHFANDALTLEELERRLELAYRARSVTELDALTADLDAAIGAGRVPAPVRGAPPAGAPASTRSPAARRSADVPATRERIVAIMSETNRGGLWPVPQRVDVRLVMASCRLDLTASPLPPVMDIHVHAVMSQLHVLVPPGVHVVNHIGVFLGSVGVELETGSAVPHGAPVVRLTGGVVMGEVRVGPR